jgi:hypothetical protein
MTRLPTSTSMGPGSSKPPFSERHFSDGNSNGHGKPNTVIACTCHATSNPSNDLSSGPSMKTGGRAGSADVFPAYSKKRESGMDAGKITFAPLDTVIEGEGNGQRNEHKNRNLNLSLPLNKDLAPPQQQQEEPTPPSRFRTLLSMVTGPFQTTKRASVDDICSSIQVSYRHFLSFPFLCPTQSTQPCHNLTHHCIIKITVTTEYELDDRLANAAPQDQSSSTVATARARTSTNSTTDETGRAI